MAVPKGARAALDRLTDLLAEQSDLDEQSYTLRAEAREYTRRDMAYVERILNRLDRIDNEREKNRIEIRRLLREKIEPGLDRASARTDERVADLEQALVACIARTAGLEERIRALEQPERKDEPRNVTHFDSKRGTGG